MKITPADEIRNAANKWHDEHPDDPIAIGFAKILEDHASAWDPDPEVVQTWEANFDRALNLARAINGGSNSGNL